MDSKAVAEEAAVVLTAVVDSAAVTVEVSLLLRSREGMHGYFPG